MRKTLCTLLLAGFCLAAYGQLRISPKFGFNFSSLNVEHEDFRSDGRSGWNLGIDFRLEHGNVFFQPGLHFQKMRLEIEPLIGSNPEGIRTRASSLKVPLNGGFYLTEESSLLHIHLRGGVVPQFITGAGEVDELGFSQDLLNNFTWGANAALGIDFILLTVEFSYEFGLSNFYNDVNGKNNMAMLNFGFIF